MRLLPDTRGLPRPFWFLFFGAFLNRLGAFVIILLALYARNARGFSVEQAGFIVSMWGAGSFLSGPFGGVLADRFGRKPVLLGSFVCGAIAMMHLAFARSFAHVSVAAALVGFAGDSFRPAMSAAVADLIPSAADRKRAYGLLYWAVNVGFSCAGLVAGALVKITFLLCFVFDAATTLLFALLVAIGLPETRPAARAPEARDAAASLAPRPPYADMVFMAFVAISFLTNVVFSQGWAPLPLDMSTHGIDAGTYGRLIALNGILVVLLQPLFTDLTKNIAHERSLAASALLIGAGMGMNAFARTAPLYALAVVVWTFGELANAPVAPAVVAEIAPSEQRGAYQGAFQLSWGGSQFVAPLAGSMLLGRFGSEGLWGTCFGVGAVAALLFLSLGRAIRARIRSAVAGAASS